MINPVTFIIYMRKAQRVLAAGRLLLREADTESACNRAYYAMFNAAHAALWVAGAQQDGIVVETHAGLASVFGQGLVKTGKVDAEHGRALGHVQKIRLLADYSADPPDDVDAEKAIALAEAFVAAMQDFVARTEA